MRYTSVILTLTLALMGTRALAQTQPEDEDALVEEDRPSQVGELQPDAASSEQMSGTHGEEDGQQEPAETLPEGFDSESWQKIYEFTKMFHFETLWYLHYRYGVDADQKDYNRFNVGRGYLTMKVKPLKWFESRITLDTHQDDHGDMKVRLKYLYGKFKVPVETKVVSHPYLEFGIVHMPWLDYEEHINWYRAQGTMFMERNKLFNSADFGATFGMLLGRELDEKYQKEVNSKYPGTWGSLALGVYNGGGYHALEKNMAKNFDARISVRPLGFIFPNLQLSYLVIVGRGNIDGIDGARPPRWLSHTFMASVEHRYFAVTGQFVIGKGNQKGTFTEFDTQIDPVTGEETITGIADVHEYMGASGFLEVKLPWIKSSIIGRYDYFNRDAHRGTHRIIGGYAFHFFKMHKNFVMVDVDYVLNEGPAPDMWETKLTLQIKL